MIELDVVGCYGSSAGRRDLSTYILNGKALIALDAGALCRLDDGIQKTVKYALITHAHVDHWRDLQVLAYNSRMPSQSNEIPQIEVLGTKETIDAIIHDGFPGSTWVPFQNIKIDGASTIKFRNINPQEKFDLDQFSVAAFPVKHPVAGHGGAVGYLISKDNTSIFYAGDTGPLDEAFWEQLRKVSNLKAVIIESSYTNELSESHARPFNHLSPKLLGEQIALLGRNDVSFYAVHFFPRYEKTLREEIKELKRKGVNIDIMEQGRCYTFDDKITSKSSEIVDFTDDKTEAA